MGMPVRNATTNARLAPVETTQRDTVHAGGVEIDRTPVTNGRYLRFVEETGHRPPQYWPNGACPKSLVDHPVVGIDFFDAAAFALWAGGSLPTELDWCRATGLAEPRAYVWGDGFDAACCNTMRSDLKGTTQVGAYPEGTAPSGAVDMCGNVWEMTCTEADEEQSIKVKGGSWYDFPAHAKIDTSFSMRAHKPGNTVGFRLVYGGALGLPAFLDTVLVAQCITFRNTRTQQTDGDVSGVDGATDSLGAFGEFESILDELRAEAEPLLRDVELEQAEEMARLLSDDAFSLFDAAPEIPLPDEDADEEVASRNPKVAAREIAFTLWAHGTELVSRHPKTLFLAACIAVGCVVGLTLASLRANGDSHTDSRGKSLHIARRRGALNGTGTSKTSPSVRSGTRDPSKRAKGARPSTKLDRALKDLLYGASDVRDEAERWLVWHGDESYDRVRAALKTNIKADVRSALLYVQAAIEEQRPGAAGKPVVLRDAPRSGLVYFLDRMDDSAAKHVRLLRRTGAAEGVPVTVVIQGRENARAIAHEYAKTLLAVRVYPDEGSLMRALRVTRRPVVIGLGRTGRKKFVLVGTVPRSHLAKKTAELK